MRRSGTALSFLACGAIVALSTSSLASAGTHHLLSGLRVITPAGTQAEKVWAKNIVISEAGNYSLLIDELAASAPTSQLSAVLVSGATTVLRADNGVPTAETALNAGTYTLYVNYALPDTSPWVSVKGTLFKDGSPASVTIRNFVNEHQPDGERVVQYSLDREQFPLGPDNQASLRIVDLSEEPLVGLEAQVMDSTGVIATLNAAGNTAFKFANDATLLLHTRFGADLEQALLDVEIADQPLEHEGLVIIDRHETPAALSAFTTSQHQVAITNGQNVTVTLRGTDLGEAVDDVGVIVTTMSAANTYKFNTAELYNQTRTLSFAADNETLHIASAIKSGDMAVLATVRNQAGKILFEQVLAGDSVIRLGTFDNRTSQPLKATVTDLAFPVRFDHVTLAALNSNSGQEVVQLSTTEEQRQVQQTQVFSAGKYHLVGVGALPAGKNGTVSLAIESGATVLFEALNTLGENTIPAAAFTLDATSDVAVRLTDHQFPAAIDELSAAILKRDGLLASGNSLVKQQLVAGRYYVAVSAKSARPGLYHLQTDATDVSTTEPVPGDNEPPRNVDGSGSNGGGGGSMGWQLAAMVAGFSAFRRKYMQRKYVQHKNIASTRHH